MQERGKKIRRRERFLLRDAEKVGFVVMILKWKEGEREREKERVRSCYCGSTLSVPSGRFFYVPF